MNPTTMPDQEERALTASKELATAITKRKNYFLKQKIKRSSIWLVYIALLLGTAYITSYLISSRIEKIFVGYDSIKNLQAYCERNTGKSAWKIGFPNATSTKGLIECSQ